MLQQMVSHRAIVQHHGIVAVDIDGYSLLDNVRQKAAQDLLRHCRARAEADLPPHCRETRWIMAPSRRR